MRLSIMVHATIAISCIVACNATTDSDQAKISTVGSPDLVHSLDVGQEDDASVKRFLRAHEDEEEERTFSVTELWNKASAKALAKAILKDPSKAQKACEKWAAKGYTLQKISDWLAVADPKNKGKKYLQIYNGYGFHLYQN